MSNGTLKIVSGGLITNSPSVSVQSGATLVVDSSVSVSVLSSAATVALGTGAKVEIDSATHQLVKKLTINGVSQREGTWGAVGSSAQYQSGYFLGNGILEIVPPRGTIYTFW